MLSLMLSVPLSISHTISQEEWLNQLTIIVKKKQEIQLFVDEGWYSEDDLVELGWSKLFPQLIANIVLSMTHCKFVKQKNCCPCLPASIYPSPSARLHCSGVGLMAQRNGAQPWVKLTAGG